MKRIMSLSLIVLILTWSVPSQALMTSSDENTVMPETGNNMLRGKAEQDKEHVDNVHALVASNQYDTPQSTNDADLKTVADSEPGDEVGDENSDSETTASSSSWVKNFVNVIMTSNSTVIDAPVSEVNLEDGITDGGIADVGNTLNSNNNLGGSSGVMVPIVITDTIVDQDVTQPMPAWVVDLIVKYHALIMNIESVLAMAGGYNHSRVMDIATKSANLFAAIRSTQCTAANPCQESLSNIAQYNNANNVNQLTIAFNGLGGSDDALQSKIDAIQDRLEDIRAEHDKLNSWGMPGNDDSIQSDAENTYNNIYSQVNPDMLKIKKINLNAMKIQEKAQRLIDDARAAVSSFSITYCDGSSQHPCSVNGMTKIKLDAVEYVNRQNVVNLYAVLENALNN